MSSEEPIDINNGGFFRQCETGTILSKYRQLKEYKLFYAEDEGHLSDAVTDFVDVISEYLIANSTTDVKALQNTTFLNEILSEATTKKVPILTDKTNPFLFRAVIKHGGGNALTDLLNPRQRTLNQIVRLYKAEIRKKIYRKVLAEKEVDTSKMAYLNEEAMPDFSEKIIQDFTKCINDLKKNPDVVGEALQEKEVKSNPGISQALLDLPNKLVVYPTQVLLTPIVSVMKLLQSNDSYCYKVFMSHFSKVEKTKKSFISRTVGRLSKSVSRGIDTIGLPVQRILTSFYGLFNICLKMAHERELLFFTEILNISDPADIEKKNKNAELLNAMFFITKMSEIIYSSGLCFMNTFTATGAHYAVSKSLKSVGSLLSSTRKGGKKHKRKTYRKKIHGGADAGTIVILILIILLILVLCSNTSSPCPLILLLALD
jgi:hypothetical protein